MVSLTGSPRAAASPDKSRQHNTHGMIEQGLTDFQKESVELFINAAAAISVPRSVGALYGLLFSTEEPQCLDDLTSTLQISRGSAHEGLRWLRSIGAVKLIYIAGQRKEHFVAETSLRRLAAGYLRDRIEPHLENGQDRIHQLKKACSEETSVCEFQHSRVNQLASWYKFVQRALPLLKALAGKF